MCHSWRFSFGLLIACGTIRDFSVQISFVCEGGNVHCGNAEEAET